jgi:hypothetical protein
MHEEVPLAGVVVCYKLFVICYEEQDGWGIRELDNWKIGELENLRTRKLGKR